MPDFSKIWATNSPLPTYTFTDADYLDGWDFIAAAPPTKNQFDAWFRQTDEKLKWLYDKLNDTANAIYPVDSVYISFNSTNPASLFGGTWTRLKDTFLLANGDTYAANTTGGSATKSISVNNLPAHNHSVNSAGAHTHTASTASAVHTHGKFTTTENGAHTHAKGTLRLQGSIIASDASEVFTAVESLTQNGALRLTNKTTTHGAIETKSGTGYMGIDFDSNRANTWSGATASSGAHTHSVTITSGGAHTHTVSVTTDGAHTHTTNNTGGSQPINIMPPYTTVYMWKRTA